MHISTHKIYFNYTFHHRWTNSKGTGKTGVYLGGNTLYNNTVIQEMSHCTEQEVTFYVHVTTY